MAKKKKSSGSKSSFNAKEFFIMHVEKLVFAFIAMIAGLVVYLGVNAKPFPAAKTPEKLQTDATRVSREIKEDHRGTIFADPERKIAAIYEAAAKESRIPKDPVANISIPVGDKKVNTRAKRGDPALAAPEQLEAKYFVGSLATLSANPDILDKLEDAKKAELKKPKPGSGVGEGPGGMGSSGFSEGGSSGSGGPGGGMGLGGGSGGGMGLGGGSGGDALMAGLRILSGGYDLGYRFGMQTFANGNGNQYSEGNTIPKPEAVQKKPVAFPIGFVCVTALAPHEVMEDQYKKEFYEVRGYAEGRDTPNYVGFEAQRIEITDQNKAIVDSDWKPLPNASSAEYKELLKRLLGTCNEVHMQDWTEPNISMPIPPVLLRDYRKIGSHSKIPSNLVEESEAGDGRGGFAGGGSGYGGNGFGEGGSEGMGDMGPGGPGGRGGSSGMGMGGSSGMGMGGSSGMGMGGSSGMGMGGSSGMGMGGSSGMGMGGSSGMGMGGSGGEGGYGGEGGAGVGFAMESPKKLASTKYKLVRFYDVTAQSGKVYKYRVRLLMYDPNYPEWEFLKPASSTLSLDALKRVQKLQSEEPKPTVSKDESQPAVVAKRKSRRETEWSVPSEPVLTVKPASVYIARGEEKPECVFVEFIEGEKAKNVDDKEKSRGIYVPRKENLDRGLVFGTPAKAKGGKEAPIDIIHPIKKVIKALKDVRTKNLVTIVDFKLGAPLLMGNASKDPIKTGMEAVSFDPATGQITISREFDNFTDFHMFTQPDMPAIGPLGGGLSGGGAAGFGGGSSSGGEEGGMGPGGMGPGGMGPGGMGPGGMGPGGMGPGGMGPGGSGSSK